MGWTFTHKPKDQSVKAFFEKEFKSEHGRVLDCAVKNRVAYIAFERSNGSGRREVFCIIALLQYRPRDQFNFGYKDMDECMGPFAADCPARILDLLTDTDDKIALKWRKTCCEHLAREKRIKKLQPGTVIELATELRFTDGRRLKRLRLVSRRPLVFADPDNQAARYKVGPAFLKTWGWTTIAA